MHELLPGRWQAYKFKSHGVDTFYDKGKGPLYKIHPDGKVEYAYFYDEQWVHQKNMVVKEQFGKTWIATQWITNEQVLSVTEDELQLGLEKRYGGFATVYYFKRLPEKKE